ncbi:MAG TPA: tyrosine-type recombinase/integrase [Blastocatellia bacterium]|nr:tyrosine-type recombinase/integrase [Blastocatellia bacterium]
MTRRSHQKGSVELHNGQWSLRYRELNHATGEWTLKRVCLGEFKSKKAAIRAAEPLMKALNERNSSRSSARNAVAITFDEFIELRWRPYTQSRHQVSTINCHNSLIKKHLIPFFGGKPVADVTPSDITDFLSSRRGKLSGNSLQTVYGVLSLMFEIASQHDLIEHNPVRSLLHKPEAVSVDKPTLQLDQIRAILLALPRQERLYNLLLAVTGMRSGEGLALRWQNFDEANREIKITHTLYRSKLKRPKTPTSKGSQRLHPRIVELLATHRGESAFRADDDFIFCRDDGRPLNPGTALEHLYNAMDAVGIKRLKSRFGFHIWRHTAGTLLFEKLGDLKQVQRVLRHADSATTDLYVHADKHPIVEGVEVLAEAILAESQANGAPTVTQGSEMVN